jgi:DNA-directed RNA polymerase specialized sigma24 family protein
MDQDLVVRVQNGDQRAFEALASADYPRLHRVAYSVLGDPASAEDATQQAYLEPSDDRSG